jgi:hypothetical protein
MKNRTGTYYFPLVLIICISLQQGSLFGQDVHKIECLARVKTDTILLRWVPSSIPVWQIGNKFGYNIHRYTIARDGLLVPDGLSNGELLTPQPIKPLSADKIEALSVRIPEAEIIWETVYGKDFQMPDPEKGFSAFIKSYQELETRFGFSLFVCDLSPEIAEAAGLFFMDVHIRSGERYAYRISPGEQPEGMDIQPAVKVVDANIPDRIPVPDELRALFSDKVVVLRWPVMLHKQIFTAYKLEKSTDGQHFRSISDLPLVSASENSDPEYFVYRDSLAQNGIQTWYRLSGITPFGENSRPSKSVSGIGLADFAAYVVIDTCAVTGENKVDLRWVVTETELGQVKSVTVQRSSNADGPYTDLAKLPFSARNYTDNTAALTNYYRILLVGDEDRMSFSFPRFMPLEDNDPPAPPVELTGVVDTLGIVTLAWKSNAEPDIMGYRVFRVNALNEDWVEATRKPVTEAIFHDTVSLNTLTHDIFYCLTAVDKRYNNSGYSEPVRLSRPDTIAPAAAIFLDTKAMADGIALYFEGSPSDDVAKYVLLRFAGNDTLSIKLNEWASGKLPAQYTDIPDVAGYYTYCLLTCDVAGNSAQRQHTCYITSSKKVKVILTVEQKSKKVAIGWQLPDKITAESFVLYKAVNGAPLTTYGHAERTEAFIVDENVETGSECAYRIKAILDNGQIVLSEVMTINIK